MNRILVRKDIAPLRSKAIAQINNAVGQMRELFITTISGQEMIYSAKEAEAIRFVQGFPLMSEVTAQTFPFIYQEIGITAPTAYELAQVWLYMAQQWRDVGSKLENARLGAIASLNTAPTPAHIDAIIAEFYADLQALA